jgi:prophage regulatory protein
MKLIKKREVLDFIAKSNTTLYSDIKLGIFTPPVVIGENSVAWPLHECNAINAARMAGKNNDEIKQLVHDLVELRKVVAGKNDEQIRALVADLFEAVHHD